MPRVSSKTTATKTTKSTRATKTTKATTRKPAAKKTTAKKPVRRVKKAVEMMFSPVKTKMGKSEIIQTLAEAAELDKKQAKAVYEAFGQMMMASVCKGSVGHFAMPGIIDVKTRHIPAKKVKAIKAGTEVRNPRTGEMTEHPGRAAYTKPATVKVRVRPLAKLKSVAAA